MRPLRRRRLLSGRRHRRPAASAAPSRPRAARRGVVLTVQLVVLVLFAALTGRMWYMQVPMAEHYQELALASHTQKLIVPALRGRIVDARGRPLVTNRTELTVTADYHALLDQDDDGAAVLRKVAELIDRPYEKLRSRVRLCGPETGRPCWQGSPYQPIPLAEDVAPKVALQVKERKDEFPGVSARQIAVREYPNGDLAAQLVGYLQPITQEEFEDREDLRAEFSGVDRVGRDGVEAVYDERLRGDSGERVLSVSSQGDVRGTLSRTPPKPGMHLATSIDTDVQQVTEDALRSAVQQARNAGKPVDSGAAVVLNVRTGHVVAMASLPNYDPEVWNGDIDAETYNRLLSEDAGEPLISRALQGQFPPGSTFKPTILAAAVKDGASLDGSYSCPGSIGLAGRSWDNFGGGGYGTVNLHKSIVVSCNTVYYQLGYEMWRDHRGDKENRDPVSKMAHAFGFGEPTGVDLPHESSGRIPDRQWKREYWLDTREHSCKMAEKGYPDVAEEDPAHARYLERLAREQCRSGDQWGAGDAINRAIGQGDVLVTPLQLARAYAAIANGGTVYEPRVGRALLSADGERVEEIEPVEAGELPLDDRTLNYIQKALTQVPKKGTASGAFGGFPQDKVSVAGKTGTASTQGRADSSWFASYAPADDPQFAVAAMIPRAGTGGSAAAPLVRKIYEGIYGFAGAEPALPSGTPPTATPSVREDGSIAPPDDH
ncbi:penicillin-binding protein 2 [Streptomonospora algeriensis]|uniref:Penicillin-binding protein 2 n=1 Tax=Streptomonospora algeriensis TaxID=995084 RepID=A0ABW3B9G7_9ACTN